MKRLIQMLWFSMLLIGCNSSNSNDSGITIDEEVEIELQTLNTDTPDSLIASYIRERGKAIPEEEGVRITAELFYESTAGLEGGSFYIVNFQEKWEEKTYEFAVVINASNEIELSENIDGIHEEIYLFLKNRIVYSFDFFEGNFTTAPKYNLLDSKLVLLIQNNDYHTSIDRTATLYHIKETRLINSFIQAISVGEVGEYEHMNGYEERFVLGKDNDYITIHVEEFIYEGDEVIYAFDYDKIYLDSEYPKGYAIEAVFSFDYAKSNIYSKVPKNKLYPIVIEGKDSLIDLGYMEFQELTVAGDSKCLMNVDSDDYSMAAHQVFDLFESEDNGIVLTLRSVFNARPTSDIFQISIEPVEQSDILCTIGGVNSSNRRLYCSDRNRYPIKVYEEEEY